MNGIGPNNTRTHRYDLRGYVPSTTAGNSNLIYADTSAAGSPTVIGVNGGGVRLTLAATNEIEVLTLYLGDILPFLIADLQAIRMKVSASASFDASVIAAFGVCSAINADLDAIAAAAMFKADGSNALVAETDDGTNNVDDITTGLSLGTTPQWFGINFEQGVQRNAPPQLPKGHASNIGFYGEKNRLGYQRVAPYTSFDMSNYAAGLQPFVRLQKSASTAVPWLQVDEIEIDYVC
jgi:hypothetical protein